MGIVRNMSVRLTDIRTLWKSATGGLVDEEVAKLLSSVDLIILPYIEASQSGVIPLAFALGKPVVVTNVGGLKEQVPDGCGLIIPPNNPKALSDAICELYNNPSKILDMGADARIYVSVNVLSWV